MGAEDAADGMDKNNTQDYIYSSCTWLSAFLCHLALRGTPNRLVNIEVDYLNNQSFNHVDFTTKSVVDWLTQSINKR